ncbi:MAG: ribosomal-processing cysteine protease Prp [Defluviitaleaceae bacterium]|nr:ribosomal-processing cysteine protease Prp [Defluviitaleaceae bacterium]
MIDIKIIRGTHGKIISFTVANHGDSIVCAAVSMLVLNTVNSIEKLTRDNFTCDYNENGGYLTFSLTNPNTTTEGINILLEAMSLGLTSAKAEYPTEIEIKEIKK